MEHLSSLEFEIRREALFVFTNLLQVSNDKETALHLIAMNDFQLLKCLATSLRMQDLRVLLEVAQTLEIVFEIDLEQEAIAGTSASSQFEQLGGVDVLHAVLAHPNHKIQSAFSSLLSKF